jgi:TolB-like protein/Tfp pilus assembly protein PilF
VPDDQDRANSEARREDRSSEADALPPNAIRSQLDKILSSPSFVNSPQLCRFLRFVVEQEITGRGDQVKEYVVGIEVLGKDEAFDPRIDTGVRTEARRLRRKLTEYYQTAGLTGTIEIDLPKGSYRPVFRMRTAAAPPPAEPPVTAAAVPAKSRRAWLAAACLPIAGLVIFWPSARVRAPEPRDSSQPSIAVLPLENLSADPEQEYFSDGMTDALITSLTGIHGLRVISRTSVLQYKRVKKPLPEIARQLGVDYVVEGTVLRVGERVRITTQLIAARNERHLWADAFDRDRGDILLLQSELARTIAGQIDSRIMPKEPPLPRAAPISPEAQDDYLRGRYNWDTRRQDELVKSVEYFERAIAKEPRYALAYAGLSDSLSVLSGRATGPDRKRLLDQAREAAKKAIALDDRLSDAHASLAVSSWDWNWEESEREFRRALELSPGNATAHHWYAELLACTGRVDEALIEARRAVELNPLSPSPNETLGGILYTGRQYDRAIQHLQRAIQAFPDFVPNYAMLGLAYEAKGMHKEAIDVLEKGLKLTGGAPTLAVLLAHAHAGAGDKSQAGQLLKEFSNRKDITPIAFAVAYMDVGDKDRAFEWFGKGVEEHSMFIDELKVEPMYDSLRSDPRFTALLRKMRLISP